jgi:hypothetical protein
LQLAGQLVLALIHAHGKGIVHRDIKPDNVFLLNQSGVRLHVRVLDFGIARIYRGDDGGKPETITHAGAVLGTPRYMSPEQLAGQPVDARSDIYSTALLIYEALTGQLPYLHGKKLSELCPEATPAMEELLAQCLKPSPDERPQNAVEVYLRLQELGKASGILLLPPGSLDRLVAARKMNEPTVAYVPKEETKGKTKRRVLVGAALVIGALAVAAAVKALLPTGPGYIAGPERVHGARVGDQLDQVELQGDFRGKPSDAKGNPWTLPQTRSLMAAVLRQSDLDLADEDLARLAVRYTDDDRLVLLANNGLVVGLVSTHPKARTLRGVGVGDDASRISKRYAEERVTIDGLPGGKPGEVYRLPALGVSFEAHGGKVTAVALYPEKR